MKDNKRKRRRRLNIKRTSICIIILILFTTLILNINNIKKTYLSKTSGYSKETISVFLETDTYNDIKKHKYSKTLEKIINTKYYNKQYLKEYLNINYLDNENFLTNINSLLNKGYNSNDINNIYNNLSEKSITTILNNEYIKDITNIISINYFKEDNLERYINYFQKEELDIETTLLYVNIGLDNEYYTNITDIDNDDDLLVLVNKYHKLDDTFIPEELDKVSYGSGTMRKEARIAFDKMCEAALNEEIYIYGGSGYRSYSHQLRLYNNYVAQDGKKEADTYSARAGHSEHQTGLAMDILNGKWAFIDDTDKEYTWLINNSYKYGFILRYPEGKEKITGYMYEPWHYRYVGTEIATKITQENLTYEEYIAKK